MSRKSDSFERESTLNNDWENGAHLEAQEESPLSISLLHQIIDVLEEILRFTEPQNEHLGGSSYTMTRKSSFDAIYTPNITPREYLLRIDEFLKYSDEIYIACLIYIDKLMEATNLTLNPRNIHKIVLASIALASKYLNDNLYSNSFLAKVGGLSAQELNNLELNFAKKLNFQMFLEEEKFERYRKRLSEFATADLNGVNSKT